MSKILREQLNEQFNEKCAGLYNCTNFKKYFSRKCILNYLSSECVCVCFDEIFDEKNRTKKKNKLKTITFVLFCN